MKKFFIFLFIIGIAAAGFVKLTYWDHYAAARGGAGAACEPGRPIPLTLQAGNNWPSARFSIPKLYLLPVPDLVENVWGTYVKKDVPAELIVVAVERKNFLPMVCAAGNMAALSEQDALKEAMLVNIPSSTVVGLDRVIQASARVDNRYYPNFDIYQYALKGNSSAGDVVDIFIARDGSGLQATCPHPRGAPLSQCTFITKVTNTVTVDYIVPFSDIAHSKDVDERVRKLIRGFIVN